MKDVMNILDRYYNSAINQTDECEFLINTTLYFQFCCKNKVLAEYLQKLQAKNDILVSEYKCLEKAVLKDVYSTEELLSKRITDYSIDKGLEIRVMEYQDIKEGSITNLDGTFSVVGHYC